MRGAPLAAKPACLGGKSLFLGEFESQVDQGVSNPMQGNEVWMLARGKCHSSCQFHGYDGTAPPFLAHGCCVGTCIGQSQAGQRLSHHRIDEHEYRRKWIEPLV